MHGFFFVSLSLANALTAQRIRGGGRRGAGTHMTTKQGARARKRVQRSYARTPQGGRARAERAPRWAPKGSTETHGAQRRAADTGRERPSTAPKVRLLSRGGGAQAP